MNEDQNIVADGARPLQFITADANRTEYRYFKTLSEARATEGAAAVMEGD